MIVQSRDDEVTLEDSLSYGIPEITTLLLWGERSVADLGLGLVLNTDYNWAESLINSARQSLSQWGLTLSKQQFQIDCYFQSSVVSSVSGPLINIQVFKVSHNEPTCKNHIVAIFHWFLSGTFSTYITLFREIVCQTSPVDSPAPGR